LYENLHVRPRFFGDGANVRIISATGGDYSLEIDAGKPTLIVSSVGWSKWWRVSPVAKAPATSDPFLSFTVPAGHTSVHIRYVPSSFYAAVVISLLTAAVLVCFMIRAGVQRHMDLHGRSLRDRDRLSAAVESAGS